jgi:UDP-N-acetylglucosamine acyltransferase
MPIIHPTAIVDRGVEVADDAQIGAYAIVGPGVIIGAGTIIHPHSVIQGPTVIGANCQIGPAAYLGQEAQHLEFLKRPLAERQQSWLVIGDHTLIRETATVHRSTKPGRENATRVGNHCMLMGGIHVAHDCVLSDNVIMANGSLLGGHCVVGPRAFLGGGSTLHQFVRVGRLAIAAGNEQVGHDVPPFAAMFYGGLKGYNAVGCRRAGMSDATIRAIRAAYQCYHTHRTMPRVLEAIATNCPDVSEVREIVEFFKSTRRGIQPSVRFLNYLKQPSRSFEE